MRDWIEPLGAAAPLAFIPVSALLTVALFPGPLLAGASGLLFGPILGFPISLTAAVLGAGAAFLISRRFGAEPVERLAGPRLQRLQDGHRAPRLPGGAVRAHRARRSPTTSSTTRRA